MMKCLCPICNRPKTEVERLTVKLAFQRVLEETRRINEAAWAYYRAKPGDLPK
jgi:hypothetical protein